MRPDKHSLRNAPVATGTEAQSCALQPEAVERLQTALPAALRSIHQAAPQNDNHVSYHLTRSCRFKNKSHPDVIQDALQSAPKVRAI